MCKVGRMRNRSVGLAVVLLGVLLTLPGCGENSRACGEGTDEVDGYCVPKDACGFGTTFDEQIGKCVPDGSVVCADGTVFDELTGECKLDENACQNGTVLIDGACVDPTAGLIIDVEEGPEPNGLGIIEDSPAQAGNIVLKLGQPFVVHGTFDPHRDVDGDSMPDPDVDTYVLTIGGPVYVQITADGVNGAAGGFVAMTVDADSPLDTWKRVGMSLVSDTADREVYLPAAGTYWLAIADTRTLIDYVTTGSSKAAPGGDTSEYYVSIKPFTPTDPTPLTLTNGTFTANSTKLSGKLARYSAAFSTGLNVVDLSMPSTLVTEALTVETGGELAGAAVSPTGAPLRAFFGGLDEGEQAVVIVDEVYTLLPSSETFSLTVRSSTATPLSTSGGTAIATATANNGSDFRLLNLFSFEATTEDATLGMQLTFSPAIVGQIYDSNAALAASFTSPSTSTTWTTYRGLVRVPHAGRYYVAVFAPSATSVTQLSVTSTITELVPEAVTKGTPLTSPVNTFRTVPFTYDAGTMDPWQQFNVTGVNTGGQVASWFDPAIAYGRLDSLVTSGGTLAGEVVPIVTKTLPVGGGAFGRVLLSDPTTSYFVKVNASSPTTSPTVTLDFNVRSAMFDLGTIGAGMSAMRSGDTLTTTANTRYYLFRAPLDASVTITVTPGAGAMNTSFRRLNADETTNGAVINNGGNGATDSVTFTQTGTDWTAIAVTASTNLSAGPSFTVNVQVQ
jgi:hypothetical protein